ncbi:hypothetical protein HY213_00960 [Candidatus Peregrinibacteria bacterium]|nr:hypothetical protein [Candidatus Peregrinibacteria bacterium]
MTAKLSQELHQALAKQPGKPLQVEDPVTHEVYVVVQLNVFEDLQHAVDAYPSEPNPREFYPLIDRVMKEDDAHDPALQSYQYLSPDRRTS